MQAGSRRSFFAGLMATLALGLVMTGAAGCKKSPKQHLRAAKRAVLNEQPDQAATHLDAVLKADPDSFEAKRLRGRVAQLNGNYGQAEEQLRGLWKSQGFGKKQAELSTEQKSRKRFLEDDLTALYQAWSESIDTAENPDKFEEVVKKGLAIDDKKPRLNANLVDFYENRAKKFVEKGDKMKAADTYDKILGLRTLPAKRKKFKKRAANLRYEVNKKKYLAYFNDKAKAKLAAQDRYDADNDAILFSVEQDVDEIEAYIKEKKGKRVRLDPRKKAVKAIVHQYTIQKKLKPALVDVVVEATGIPEDSNFDKVQTPEGFKIVDVDAKRNSYTINARLPVDEVLKLGSQVREQTRKARAQPDKDGADAPADDDASAKADAKPANNAQ